MSQNQCLFRAADLEALPSLTFRHPLNPNSEIDLRSLSLFAGLQRFGLHIGRVPPGKESFAYHYHHREEEFVYILSGRGVAEIGEEKHEVGPGDCMLFTAPSVGHHLANPFDVDLVYLMGGESSGMEIGEFPRLGKRAIFERGQMAYIIDADAAQPFVPRG
jgi:uncharacterized cupin superfamily protein